MQKLFIQKLFVSFLSVLLVFLISCDEDSLHQEHHFEAIGTAVYDSSGEMIVSILRGVTDDTLKIPLNNSTGILSLKFYDDHEDLVDGPDEEESSLSYESETPQIFEFYPESGSDSKYKFSLEGLSSGNSYIELLILHDGHTDYRSGQIPVLVY